MSSGKFVLELGSVRLWRKFSRHSFGMQLLELSYLLVVEGLGDAFDHSKIQEYSFFRIFLKKIYDLVYGLYDSIIIRFRLTRWNSHLQIFINLIIFDDASLYILKVIKFGHFSLLGLRWGINNVVCRLTDRRRRQVLIVFH